ncbi:type II toxin-antitoxin system RelE/ParE family toxin [Candidatus Daviesbacteria bacterium]|nr:type II toxin-antitoxin system RelE/ParE family toxin [Candidatus Daviesbacteria bacterium]
MYKVKITFKAKKELKNLNKLDRLSIAEIIEELKEDPKIGKPLSRELIRKFSYRVGAYRVIYIINHQDKIVIVLSAGHRGLVYN